MKRLAICKPSIILWIFLLTATSLLGQERYKERFDASEDMVVKVNTAYTNVIFETWNKDKVEVEAFVEGDNLTSEQKREIFKNWDLDVVGNSKKVEITSSAIAFGEGIGALAGMDALKSLESLKSLKVLGTIPAPENMPDFDFDFNFDVPDVPDFKEVPEWPFTKGSPTIKHRNGDGNIHFGNQSDGVFDEDTYQKDKKAYVAKLNKKYGTNVSVRQVDRWLEDVDQWAEDFEKVMEKWGEDFGMKFSQKFGPDFEIKMEKWGEEFGKNMEAWGEEFGEKFSKDMEKWGEEFGEKFGEDIEKWSEEFGGEIEKWAEEFEKDAEEWAKKYEEEGGNYHKKIKTDENGNKAIIIKRENNMHFSGKANKTIIVRMPKGTKTEVNVKHGELKMANAYDMKADLNYAKLTANSIDGGKTLINASYAPVYVNVWHDGALKVNYVEDCRLNSVKNINLQSNSSDVNINEFRTNGVLSGSFGNLFIGRIADGFESLDVVLENTDASMTLPNTAFDFYYNGKKSRFEASHLSLKETNTFDRKILKGHHKSSNSGRSITITANYSNVSVQ